MALNSKVSKNNPVWNKSTLLEQVDTQTGATPLTVRGSYAIFSNRSGVTIYIGTVNTTQGVMVEPGGSFEIAVDPEATIHINAAANVGNGVSILWLR